MHSIKPLSLSWVQRTEPLPASAMFTPSTRVKALLQQLLSMPDDYLQKLDGLQCDAGILITGQEADLPWINGCLYLGMDQQAHHCLMSTQHQPTIPTGLLDQAIAQRYQQTVAIIPGCDVLIPVSGTRTLARKTLKALYDATA